MHGPFLTPQKSGDEKVQKNLGMQGGEKNKKNVEGVFFTEKVDAKKLVLMLFEHL